MKKTNISFDELLSIIDKLPYTQFRKAIRLFLESCFLIIISSIILRMCFNHYFLLKPAQNIFYFFSLYYQTIYSSDIIFAFSNALATASIMPSLL